MLTFEVEKVNSASEPLEETHVDEDAGGVKLDVACVLGAVVGVVPFVGRQQQLHQSVRRVGVAQRRVMCRVQSDTRHRLQHETQQMLRTSTTRLMPIKH